MSDPGPNPTPTDDAIREMLEDRAQRAQPVPLDVESTVVGAGRQGSRRIRFGDRLAPGLSLATTSVAAALVATLVVGVAIASRPTGSEIPSGPTQQQGSSTPSTTGESPTPAPTPFAFPSLLTPAELDGLLQTRADELNQKLVAVRGRLRHDLALPCSACDDLMFQGAGAGFRMRRPPPPTTWGPDPADFGLVDRTYVVRITGDLVDGLPVVDLLGEIATGRAGGLTVTVDEVLKGGLGAGGQFVAIDGWLVRDALHPCPALPLASGTPSDGPKYGCPDDDYLTDLEFQPLQGDGSSVGPPDGLFLPAGTYDQWAPSPAFFGQYGVGVVPRRATYLVRLVASNPGKELPCGSAAGCSLVTVVRWQIVGRLDPIPELPSTPAELASPSEAPVHSVADFVGGLPADIRPSEFTIRAYLVSTPPLKCVGAAPPGLPDYSCGERDWLTDEPFQPWVADGNTGSTRDPAVGLRVENGAYDLFAPDPGIGAHAAREPRLGTYLVRFAVHSTCDYAIQSPANGCLGGPIFTWEVIGRLP